jgi:uncharacterized protein involved in exopolysaccharide biosynthesis
MEENYRLLKPFLRGFPLIVAAVIISVLVAKKYLSYVTPMYESTAKLKLADVSEGVPSSNLFKDFDVFTSANKIAAEIEVLKSSVLLNKTFENLDFDIEIYRVGKIKTMELYHDSPILIQGTFDNPRAYDKRYKLLVTSDSTFELTFPDTQAMVNGKFGEEILFDYGQMLISLNEAYIANKEEVALIDLYEFEFLSRQKLAGKINSNLDIVSVDKDVAVIRINLRSPVPEKASAFVNQLSETYIYDYIETKYNAAETTVNFLAEQITDVAGKLSETETIIEDYRNNKNIINIRQETETDLRQISQLKIQQTNIEMNLLAIEDLNEYIQSRQDSFLLLAPNFEAFNDLLSTEIVKNIKALQAEKKDLLLIFTPEEERVKVIDRKIDDLKSYLIESIGNTKRNLEIKYNKLSLDIENAEKVFIGMPGKEKNLTIMNREFEIYQQSYNFLNEKKIEAEIAQAAKIAFHRILAPGHTAKNPVSPNRPIIIIVSAILGMFSVIVLIYLVHLAKAKVNDAYTIEKNSSIPIALLTPRFRNISECDRHFLKEAIQLELKGLLQEKGVLVLSSNSNREGRSFHALQLSKALALQGRKVLLLDVESRLSHLNKGLTNKLSETGIENIDYLDLNHPDYNRFTKKALLSFINDYRAKYEVIIVNNEALENETRGLLFMGIADTNLFILDSRRTAASQIIKTDILKEEFKLPVTWFVLNKSGYNPNVIREFAEWLRSKTSKNKKEIAVFS